MKIIRKITIILFYVILLLSPALMAQNTGDQPSGITEAEDIQGLAETDNPSARKLFDEAGEYYRLGKWDYAAANYIKIIKSGIENHIIFYNLGNCYFRMKKIGPAMLAWEKALKLNPGDIQIEQNIAFASRMIADKFEEPERHFLAALFSGIVSLFSVNGWFIITIIFTWLGGTAFFIFQTTSKRVLKRVVMYLVIVFILFIFTTGILTYISYNKIESENYGIILAPSVQVRSGPGNNNPVLFVLHEGVKVNVESEQGEWTRISVPNGFNGWINKRTFGLI
ncbi:MAG: SH3 domain-containing protein [Acidobacteria bacterium]|nr:SH3 domain-containing protein [Acidobacteriota bacterium]